MKMCPNCGDGELKYRCAESVEPHGERFTDEWYECSACRAVYTEAELRLLERDEEERREKGAA